MEESFSERLKKAKESNRLTIEEMAATIGMSPRMYSYYESGEKKGDEKKIAKYLARLQDLENGNLHIVKKEKKSGVPVYNVDFTAGDVTQFIDNNEKVIGHVDFDGFRNCVAFVRVKGSSMYPDFVAGDYIGLEKVKNFKIIEYGQPFGVVTKTGQRMIKIIRSGVDDDNLILRSANKEYDDIRIHKEDIQELYKVHGPLRDQWQ